jgi:hypothetical protein
MLVAIFTAINADFMAQCGVKPELGCSILSIVKSGSIVIVAAIVAIVLVVAGFRIFRNRRGLVAFYRNGDKECQDHQPPAPGRTGKRVFTRIKVTNNSPFTIKRCRGNLISILDDSFSTDDHWLDSQLYWPGEEFEISLEPHRHNFLNIVWTEEGNPLYRVRRYVDVHYGVDWERPKGTYYFNIVITGDDSNTINLWYRVIWDGVNYDKFRMTQIAQPKTVSR